MLIRGLAGQQATGMALLGLHMRTATSDVEAPQRNGGAREHAGDATFVRGRHYVVVSDLACGTSKWFSSAVEALDGGLRR